MDDRQRAAKLLEIYGGQADDFFKLWPPDKHYFFSADGKAFVAYAVKRGVAVCMGDPAGRPESVPGLLGEFLAFCKDSGRRPIFIQTGPAYQTDFAGVGLRRVLIGADAVIELDEFVNDTAHNKYFRNIVNRFGKEGFVFSMQPPPHGPGLLKEVRAVSNSWLKLPHRKEWSFLTGRPDDAYLKQVPLYLLRDPAGRLQAFANGLPVYKPGTATIDLMRHRHDAPPNSIDYLFVSLLHELRGQGYQAFNLGMSPLDGQPSGAWLPRVYRLGNRFIGFKGLHQFKAKYRPAWEPRYVNYQGRGRHLPRYALAILGLMRADQPTRKRPGWQRPPSAG